MVHRGRFPGLVPGKRVCGPLRLPDVKPPCSNLAGTLVPAIFFWLAANYLRLTAKRPTQVQQASDQPADQCPGDADVLQVTADNRSSRSVKLPASHCRTTSMMNCASPVRQGTTSSRHRFDRAVDPRAHRRIGAQMLAERMDRGADVASAHRDRGRSEIRQQRPL